MFSCEVESVDHVYRSFVFVSLFVLFCVCVCGLGNDEILCFLVYLDINKCSIKFDFLIFLLLMNTILLFYLYFKFWFNG